MEKNSQEDIKELEKIEAEKVKKVIDEIENKVKEMLQEIQETRIEIRNWESLEHVGWKLGINPRKEKVSKK